ncbi:MAG: hypothetical protein IT307_01480 [Chloroflexi bacterium]|nr:hypothetical protein [Chloroflexota bacterium]
MDFLIPREGRAYGVGLSTETERGRSWHEGRDVRHGELPVPVLELYAEPERHVISDFWLHRPEDVDQVEAFIAQSEVAMFDEAEGALWQVYHSAKRRKRCSRQDFADGFVSALASLRAALSGQRAC